MPATQYRRKVLLDYAFGGATPPAMSALWLQWATGIPTDSGASDGPFTGRQTVNMGPGISPAGTVTNLNGITGLATVIATATGWNIYDNPNSGNRLFYGTMTAALGVASGSQPAFAAGALQVTMI